jgi:hypothetical protein
LLHNYLRLWVEIAELALQMSLILLPLDSLFIFWGLRMFYDIEGLWIR